MRKLANLATLVRLVLLLLAASSSRIWGARCVEAKAEASKLSSHAKAPAELENLRKRHAEIEQKLARQVPVAVRKMSEDPSEMFFPEYWQFELELEPEEEPISTNDIWEAKSFSDTTTTPARNTSQPTSFLPPVIPQIEPQLSVYFNPRQHRRNVFDKRDYQCPSGYHDCSSIGVDDACCSQGQECQVVSDTGVGAVGCCPRGTKCTGSVGDCDESQGYTSCPHRRNPNGCCAPGFECAPIGCVRRRDATTVTTPTQTVVGVTTRKTVSTTVVTDPSTVYTTTTYPTSTRTIGPVVQSDTEITTRTITSAAPPVRPTDTFGYCPTGYYRCSAFYVGGCCQVGRDCRSTNCPIIASAEATANGVVTVVIATGAGVTTIYRGGGVLPPTNGPAASAGPTTVSTSDQNPGSGSCAQGWYNCGADNGGGCCPLGYSCSAKCIATQSGIPDTALKAPVNNGAPNLEGWRNWAIAFAGAIGLAALLL